MANMLKTRLLYAILTCACVCLLGPTGCGGKKGTDVTGKLVLPAGVQLAENDSINIRFIPQKEDKTGKGGGSGGVSPTDLSFTVKDIAPGKYKISVNIQPYPGSEQVKHAAAFAPLNKTFEAENTPLTYEVT